MLRDLPPVSRSPRGTRSNLQDNVRAGTVRVILAVFCLVALPVLMPASRAYVGVMAAYLAAVSLIQVAIVRDIGGAYRVLLGGVVDIAFLSFVVYRSGFNSTPLIVAYLTIGTFNAMAVPAWAAITLASWGIAAYAVVAYGEALGFWPHAPDHPELAALAPSVRDATNTVLLLAMFVAISTAVLIRIVRALNLREEELRKANLRLEELSQQDPLTLLYNRRYFVRRAQEELERVRRGHSLALLMMDLDGFKQVNDRFGHLTGDEVLKSIALALTSSLRSVDVLGRYGGDEFVVLLTDTDDEEAALVAKRLNTKIREASARVAPASPVTASVGIAMARPDHDVTILLNLADDAAYRAKQAGGNRHSLAPVPAIDDEGAANSGLRASNAG